MAPLLGWTVVALAATPHLIAPATVNHDCGWYLYAAGQVLDGARPYVDIVDVNPPLILYLSMLPVALGRALDLPAVTVFHGLVTLWVVVSLSLSARVLQRLNLFDDPVRDRLALGVQGYGALVAVGADFGQREHLLLVALTPWCWTAAARAAEVPLPRITACAIGTLAGIGIALKPHFLLVPVAVGGLLVLRGRWHALCASDNVALGLVLVLYLLHFAALPSDIATGIVQTFTLARQTYGGLETTWQALFATPTAIECAVLGAAWVFASRRGPASHAANVLGATWLALLVAALCQATGWSYHFVAASGVGWTLLTVVALRAPASRGMRRATTWGCAALLLFGTVRAAVVLDQDGLRLQKPVPAQMAETTQLRRLAGNAPVLVLDTGLWPHFPLFLYANVVATSRYPCLWPLPGLLHQPPSDHRDRLEQNLRDHLLADLRARAPHLVIVKKPPLDFVDDSGFDILGWAQRDPRFVAACGPLELVAETAELAYYRRR